MRVYVRRVLVTAGLIASVVVYALIYSRLVATNIIRIEQSAYANDVAGERWSRCAQGNVFFSNSSPPPPFSVHIDGQRYPKVVPLYENRSIDFKCLRWLSSANRSDDARTRKRKTILLWTSFAGLVYPTSGFGWRTPFERMNCPISECELTDDRAKLNHSTLVLFHMRDSSSLGRQALPAHAHARQRFVHVIHESPLNCPQCVMSSSHHQHAFDLSATYTRSSHFTSIYWLKAGIAWGLNATYDVARDRWSAKSEFAAALISSNCGDSSSARLKYIALLNKHLGIANLQVTVYGRCGQACPGPASAGTEAAAVDCRAYVAQRARFFLAFENSVCRDYVTEKVFETLRYDTVPVVLGLGNYDDYMPRSAYVNALDARFATPAHLARYLLYLNANRTAYNDYFRWKKWLRFAPRHANGSFVRSGSGARAVSNGVLCEMCIRLHLEDHQASETKQLGDLNELFAANRNCKRARYDPASENILYEWDASLRANNI